MHLCPDHPPSRWRLEVQVSYGLTRCSSSDSLYLSFFRSPRTATRRIDFSPPPFSGKPLFLTVPALPSPSTAAAYLALWRAVHRSLRFAWSSRFSFPEHFSSVPCRLVDQLLINQVRIVGIKLEMHTLFQSLFLVFSTAVFLFFLPLYFGDCQGFNSALSRVHTRIGVLRSS